MHALRYSAGTDFPEQMSSFAPSAPPLVVVGAGAAGIVAAITVATAGQRVRLLERTRDGGRKILVSGGGRCNVLPVSLQPERFVTDSSPRVLRRLLEAWPLAEQRRFFADEAGVALRLEPETGKFFPASNQAREVRDRLLALAVRRGVEVVFGALVTDLRPPTAALGGWRIGLDRAESVEASAVILATGGLSMPGTGSDGRGLAIVAALGHTVHDTYPALTPLTASPPPHRALAGISRDVVLHAPGAKPKSVSGGFLFTHRGYSGPAVLDLSHLAVRSRLAGGMRQRLLVQWTELDAPVWDNLLRTSAGTALSLLRRSLPERLAEAILVEAAIDPARGLAHLPRAERLRLVEKLVRYPLPWTGDEGYAQAEVTGGGVALDEIDPRTLESRRHPGLYLCGEMLDAFGPIGGHNFAWAWATGRAAGLGAGRRLGGHS
jgi:predicted Rossmann fold flavoprotein